MYPNDGFSARLALLNPISLDQEVSATARLLTKRGYDGWLPYFLPIIRELISENEHLFRYPSRDDSRADFKCSEIVEFYNKRNRSCERMRQRIADLLITIVERLPSVSEGPFLATLSDLLQNKNELVLEFLNRTYGKGHCSWLFTPTRRSFFNNLTRLTGVGLLDSYPLQTTWHQISEVISNQTNPDFLRLAFKDTVFESLLSAPYPMNCPESARFNHMHVVGGTGAGKTTLLENLILHDLQGQASIVVVDSQGDLIRKISHLKRWKDDDRLVLITPKDTRFPPALNVFDLNKKRLGQYDEGTKEQVIAGVIQTFDYLFGSLLGADLTAKQAVFFRFVARLMLSLPETMGRNATILDMLHLMEDPAPYQKAIETLPPIQRNFFERDFKSKTFAQTKEQIRYRLHAIIENPTLARLFTSQSTKIDLFTELNRGSVILVDTAKDFLKGSSAHFGQVFISLILQAVLERAAIPENQRRPTFMFVDEAAEYFDQNIDDLLTEARKHKLGAVFAHQYLDQASHALRASFAANTGIKFASGISMSDARAMAPDMRTTPEFILSQPRLHFAAYIRNVTQQAVSIPVKVGSFDNEPRLTDDEYKHLMRRNRDRVSVPHMDTPQSPPPEDEDVSETW